jgi:hypothetical protein
VVLKWFVPLRRIVGEDNKIGFCLERILAKLKDYRGFLLTLQCAHALVLYNALNLSEQIWQVWWLHGAIDVCSIVLAQMKQTSPSMVSSTAFSVPFDDVSCTALPWLRTALVDETAPFIASDDRPGGRALLDPIAPFEPGILL